MPRSPSCRPAPLALAVVLALAALTAHAQGSSTGLSGPPASFNLAAQPLSQALSHWALQTGVQLIVQPALVAGKTAPAVSGTLTPSQALERLLAGSGLVAAREGNAVVIKAAPPVSTAGDVATLPDVKVTAQAVRDGTTEGTDSYTTNTMSTATGLALSPRETPQSVTVMTRQRMDDEGLVTFSDAIRATPGMTVDKIGPERDFFYARGFTVGNITYDGLPTTLAPSYGSEMLLSDLVIYDRVEIVRGAAGLMTGAGNPSAAVNLVRKRPTKETQVSLTGNAGNWSRYGLQIDASGSLNEAQTLRARAVASLQDNKSFQDVVSSRRNILYLTAEADLSPQTLLTVGAVRQQNDNTTSWGGLPTAADGSDLKLPRSTFLGNDWERMDKRGDTVFASLEHRFDNGWKLRGAATRIKARQHLLGTVARLNTGTGMYNQDFGDYIYTDKQKSYDLQASGPFELFGRTHELVLGANQRSGDFYGYGGGDTTFYGMDIYHWDHSIVARPVVDMSEWYQGSTDRQRSIYATTRINLADPLKLIVGGRFDWYDFQGQSPWSIDDYKVNRNLTKYAGLVYDIDQQHSIYVSYTDIFKPQNYYDAESKLLDPVVGKNYEMGIKGEYFGGRLNASAAVFRVDQANIAMEMADQSACPNYPAQSCYQSAGLVRSQGLDLEVQGALTRDWRIGAGYTYVDKTIKKNANPALVGTRADSYLPKHQLKLSTVYHVPGEWLNGGWRVGGNLMWQSGIYREGTGFRSAQKAYAIVGLMAGYRAGKHWDVQLNINNLFDKTYYQGLNFAPAQARSIYGAPRNVMLMARYTF